MNATLPGMLRGTPRVWGVETVLEAIVALTAISGGLTLALTPDGSAMGAPLSVLERTPFTSFFWPGVLLALVVGGLNAIAAVLTVRKSAYASAVSFIAGNALAVFVGVEVLLIRERSFLQVVFFALGVTIAGLALLRNRARAAP